MDPTFYRIDFEMLFEVLITLVVFSAFIERALALVFESRWFIAAYEANPKRKGIKELVAVVVSIAVCIFWKFDAFSVIILAHDKMTVPGFILTGMVVAGGAKASIKLFKDVMGFMSSAEKERLQSKNKTGKKK